MSSFTEQARVFWENLADRAFHDKRMEEEFNRGKRVSDFVGMLIRMSFCLFWFKYMADKASSTRGLSGWAFGACSVWGFALAVFLGSKATTIMFHYFARDVAAWHSTYMRTLFFLSAITIYLSLLYGTWDIAAAVSNAQSTKLAPPGTGSETKK